MRADFVGIMKKSMHSENLTKDILMNLEKDAAIVHMLVGVTRRTLLNQSFSRLDVTLAIFDGCLQFLNFCCQFRVSVIKLYSLKTLIQLSFKYCPLRAKYISQNGKTSNNSSSSIISKRFRDSSQGFAPRFKFISLVLSCL